MSTEVPGHQKNGNCLLNNRKHGSFFMATKQHLATQFSFYVEVEGHIAFGLSIILSIRHAF